MSLRSWGWHLGSLPSRPSAMNHDSLGWYQTLDASDQRVHTLLLLRSLCLNLLCITDSETRETLPDLPFSAIFHIPLCFFSCFVLLFVSSFQGRSSSYSSGCLWTLQPRMPLNLRQFFCLSLRVWGLQVCTTTPDLLPEHTSLLLDPGFSPGLLPEPRILLNVALASHNFHLLIPSCLQILL